MEGLDPNSGAMNKQRQGEPMKETERISQRSRKSGWEEWHPWQTVPNAPGWTNSSTVSKEAAELLFSRSSWMTLIALLSLNSEGTRQTAVN